VSSQFSAILFLLAFLLEVAHDAIPHHHPDANEIVVASHHIHQGAGTIFQSEDDHQHQFPPHQHYYTNEDLTASRTGISVQFDLKKSICESVLLYIAKNASFYKPPGLHSYCIISVSLQFRPFIISPDAVRGSPYLV
jgi:hypothetical protein